MDRYWPGRVSKRVNTTTSGRDGPRAGRDPVNSRQVLDEGFAVVHSELVVSSRGVGGSVRTRDGSMAWDAAARPADYLPLCH